jgi:hypothetical protein
MLAETTDLHATALLPLQRRNDVRSTFAKAGIDRLLSRLHPEREESVIDELVKLGVAFTEGLLRHYSTVEINPLFLTHSGHVAAGDVLIA